LGRAHVHRQPAGRPRGPGAHQPLLHPPPDGRADRAPSRLPRPRPPGGSELLTVGVREEVAKLVGNPRALHKRLVDYVVRQVRAGRPIAEVLNDPYVTNRAGALDRRALLEEPAVVDAVGEEVLGGLRSQLDSLAEREAR